MPEENKVENDNELINVEVQDIAPEEESLNSDIVSKTINYLDKEVLDMKTINFNAGCTQSSKPKSQKDRTLALPPTQRFLLNIV